MPTRFEYDYRGVGEYMRTDPELAGAVRARAELALRFARSIAPVGTPAEHDHHPGHFRDSLSVTGPTLGAKRDRVTYRVESDASYALAVEHTHHIMVRTVAALGDPKGGEGL